MTADQLSLFAGVLLSLIFSYVPGLSTSFAGMDSVTKRAIMAGALLVIALAVFGLSCGRLLTTLPFSVSCDQAGIVSIATAFVLALISNQSTYLLTPQTSAVAQAVATSQAKAAGMDTVK